MFLEILYTIYNDDIFNASIRPSARPSVRPPDRPTDRPSVCPSRYLLLNHWLEFYQTCYITSSYSKGVQEQNYFSVRASVRRLFIWLSHYLLLNLKAEFNQTCYITPLKPLGGKQPNATSLPLMARVCESSIVSVRPPFVHLYVTKSPPKPLGEIQPNLLHNFPLWLGCAWATFFPCVCPSVRPPSVHLSITLSPKHWAEFNQTCYITSPHGKGVREQLFSVRLSSVHLLVTLYPPKKPGRIQPNLLHLFPSWKGCARAKLFFRSSVWRLSICPSRYLL